MKKSIIFALVASVFLNASAIAGGNNVVNSGPKSPPSAMSMAVSDLLMANQLAAYGLAKSDSLALISAASIIKDIPTKPGDVRKDGGAPDEKVDGTQFTYTYLLDKAKEFSGGRKEILDTIKGVESRGARGLETGPVAKSTTVKAHTADVYSARFKGLEQAIVGVIGKGDVDFNCTVHDENGGLVTSDRSTSSVCAMEWTPIWAGTYKIKVINASSKPIDYLLYIN